MESQLKSIGALESYADIHPIVIHLDAATPSDLASIIHDPMPRDALLQLHASLKETAHKNRIYFTHTVAIKNGFDATLHRLVEVYTKAVVEPYWASSPLPLPLNPPEALGSQPAATALSRDAMYAIIISQIRFN
jgi:hypothetical protein